MPNHHLKKYLWTFLTGFIMRHILACFVIINKTNYFRFRLCHEELRELKDIRGTWVLPESFRQTRTEQLHIVTPWAPVWAKNNQHLIWETIAPISFSVFLSTNEDAGSIKYINQDCLGIRSSQSYSLRIYSRNTINILYTWMYRRFYCFLVMVSD